MDRAQLARMVRNLVANGIKFTAGATAEAPGEVVLRAHRTADGWLMEVEDNGIGISPAVLRHIFEETYRVPDADQHEVRKGHPPGRGLGLAIVQRLCALVGGRISVHSRRGQGTRFRITFPRRAPQGASPGCSDRDQQQEIDPLDTDARR